MHPANACPSNLGIATYLLYEAWIVVDSTPRPWFGVMAVPQLAEQILESRCKCPWGTRLATSRLMQQRSALAQLTAERLVKPHRRQRRLTVSFGHRYESRRQLRSLGAGYSSHGYRPHRPQILIEDTEK